MGRLVQTDGYHPFGSHHYVVDADQIDRCVVALDALNDLMAEDEKGAQAAPARDIALAIRSGRLPAARMAAVREIARSSP